MERDVLNPKKMNGKWKKYVLKTKEYEWEIQQNMFKTDRDMFKTEQDMIKMERDGLLTENASLRRALRSVDQIISDVITRLLARVTNGENCCG
ncbi:hypothetical protein NPIL_25261 [Nephila pilipes]|uniref:Uncharacterized protein n=1 Tax=Nephila pilipes TaxID=299642 RepID=A0A8X6QD87_NEPPI|nr:hypothetical protein NPIL_107621 [Nephila pilipes]GFU20451.1 hypothetical protein NPIL_25261 [Nephila pilipes]